MANIIISLLPKAERPDLSQATWSYLPVQNRCLVPGKILLTIQLYGQKVNPEKWCSKGHGTKLEDAKGKWWMIYHAYEKEFYNKGRQTLLQPIEWTKDGWYKIPDGISDSKPIKKPGLLSSKSTFTLNDKFESNSLKPQWRFFGEYDTSRFQLAGNGIAIKAKGNTIDNSSPLLCIPSIIPIQPKWR